MTGRENKHADLPKLLAAIDPHTLTYDEWLKIGMGLKSAEFGVEVWDEFSSRDPDRYEPGVCASKWETFTADGGITGATVAQICAERGVNVGNAAITPVKKPELNKYGFTAEESRTHHRALIEESRRTLRDSDEAKRLAAPYLSAHCGMTVEEAIDAGLGVVDADTIRRAGSYSDFTGMYRDGYTRLVFPARGSFDYYHIDRDISEGYEGRGTKEYRDKHPRYRKYAKPTKEAMKQPNPLNPDAIHGKDGVCFVVEGWPDALAVEAAGYRATPVLSSSSNGTLQAIEARNEVEQMRVVLMLDNDETGRPSTEKAVARLEKKGVIAIPFAWPEGAPKDAGEWRAEDPAGFASALGVAHAQALAAQPKLSVEPIDGYSFFDEERQPRIEELVQWMKGSTELVAALKLNDCDGEYWKLAPTSWDPDPTPRPWDDSRDGAAVRMVVEHYSTKKADRHSIRDAMGVFTSAVEHRFSPLRDAILNLPKVEKNTGGGLNVTETGEGPFGMAPLYDGAPTCLGSVSPAPRGMGYALTDEAGNIIENVTCVAGWTLARFLGATPCRYTYEVERVTFRAIIARALYPGCDFQLMPILYGAQGIGKDTFWKACALAPSLFVTLARGMDEKSISQVAPGHLVADVEELAAMKGTKSLEQLKSAVSRNSDVRHVNYRGDFDLSRSFVMVGSTNSRDVLSDETGNRRFPIIECHATKRLADSEREEMFRAVRIGIAEMLEEHDRIGKDGFLRRLRLPDAVLPDMAAAQATFTEADEWAESIREWLDRAKPEITCREMAAKEALGILADDFRTMRRPEQNRISRALDSSPSYRRTGRQRVPGYGTLTAWRRKS